MRLLHQRLPPETVKGQRSKVKGLKSLRNIKSATDARAVRPYFVEAMHSKPTLFAAFLLFLAKNAMSASLLNAFS